MTNDLNRIAAFFFYLLGASFFIAYLLMRNNVYGDFPSWWMQVADLPLVLVAILYGGTSLYLSVKPQEGPARLHPLVIVLPLAVLFLVVVALNFWELLGG